MKIKTIGYVLRIEKAFIAILETEMNKNESQYDNYCILNFRDPTYSARTGGYHPVEIMINKQGMIQYITDFSYIGSIESPELVKEIDFDFSSGIFEQMGRCFTIEEAYELIAVWQQNFMAYYQNGVFDVSISCD